MDEINWEAEKDRRGQSRINLTSAQTPVNLLSCFHPVISSSLLPDF